MARELRQFAGTLSADGIVIEVDVLRTDTGFETPLTSPILAAIQDSDGPVTSVAFGTEAPWLARMGAEAVVIGAGSMLTAHSPRECVPIAELNSCVEKLHTAIQYLCC